MCEIFRCETETNAMSLSRFFVHCALLQFRCKDDINEIFKPGRTWFPARLGRLQKYTYKRQWWDEDTVKLNYEAEEEADVYSYSRQVLTTNSLMLQLAWRTPWLHSWKSAVTCLAIQWGRAHEKKDSKPVYLVILRKLGHHKTVLAIVIFKLSRSRNSYQHTFHEGWDDLQKFQSYLWKQDHRPRGSVPHLSLTD